MNRLLCFLALWFMVSITGSGQGPEVINLQCNQESNPLGIRKGSPLLSWEIASCDKKNTRQDAYQVLVASSMEMLDDDVGDVWNSGEIESGTSWQISYQGESLESRRRYFWKVRIRDNHGDYSPYSEHAWFETALLNPEDWEAQWIAGPSIADWKQVKKKKADGAFHGAWDNEAPMFRKEFRLDKEIVAARMYISGLGYYEAYINGQRIGNDRLDPAFTRYDKRVLYRTYDVSGLLKQGNAVGVILGNGWYNFPTQTVWSFDHAPWRGKPRLLLQIDVWHADGSHSRISTDQSWKVHPSPVRFNSVMQGMLYDARMEQEGWNQLAFQDDNWQQAFVVSSPGGRLKPQEIEAIRGFREFNPESILETRDGRFLLDFGQNMAGWARIAVQGQEGDTIILRYGEAIRNDSVYQGNIEVYTTGVVQTDRFVIKGAGKEQYESRFTYHGFRYIEVSGFQGSADELEVVAVAAGTDFEVRGSISCSDSMINSLQHNTRWSYRSNFFGYPTDCPQREKNGWTGDAQIAVETGLWNYHSGKAYAKFLNDMKDEQRENGNLPAIIPTSQWGYTWGNGPAWIGAYLIIPWEMYVYNADVRVLEEHYEGMKKLVGFFRAQAGDHILRTGLGDWAPYKTRTPVELTSTAYYFHYASLLGKMAAILGNEEDSEHYTMLSEDIRAAFIREFYDPITGRFANGSQTAQSCALYFGLYRPEDRGQILDVLLTNIRQNDYHIDTGILGAKFLPHALADNGYAETALKIITNTGYPGWGWWVEQGATTLWEFWDGMESKPIGSLNHIMYGDISNWFYRNVLGISPDETEPGFRHFTVDPKFWDVLSWSKGQFHSIHGDIKVSSRTGKENYVLELVVPCNTTATVKLPARDHRMVKVNGKRLSRNDSRILPGEKVSLETGSGSFVFEIERK